MSSSFLKTEAEERAVNLDVDFCAAWLPNVADWKYASRGSLRLSSVSYTHLTLPTR